MTSRDLAAKNNDFVLYRSQIIRRFNFYLGPSSKDLTDRVSFPVVIGNHIIHFYLILIKPMDDDDGGTTDFRSPGPSSISNNNCVSCIYRINAQ